MAIVAGVVLLVLAGSRFVRVEYVPEGEEPSQVRDHPLREAKRRYVSMPFVQRNIPIAVQQKLTVAVSRQELDEAMDSSADHAATKATEQWIDAQLTDVPRLFVSSSKEGVRIAPSADIEAAVRSMFHDRADVLMELHFDRLARDAQDHLEGPALHKRTRVAGLKRNIVCNYPVEVSLYARVNPSKEDIGIQVFLTRGLLRVDPNILDCSETN